MFQAMLEAFRALGVSSGAELYLLMMAMKVIRQSRTIAIAHQRFRLFCRVLPRILMDEAVRTAVIKYLRDNWMAERWIRSWVDAGRYEKGILTGITTGNQAGGVALLFFFLRPAHDRLHHCDPVLGPYAPRHTPRLLPAPPLCDTPPGGALLARSDPTSVRLQAIQADR